MARLSKPLWASEISKVIGGILEGKDVEVRGIAPLNLAQEGDISFAWGSSLKRDMLVSKASVLVVPERIKCLGISKTLIRVRDPRRALALFLKRFFKTEHSLPPGVHELAFVEEDVSLGSEVRVGPFAYLGKGVSIGARTIIYPFVFIGKDVKIGEDCVIYPMVSIREGTEIGNRVVIHSGAVIGSDGYGFIPEERGIEKIPQVGIVVIEDEVEIGANVTIDRATIGETRIGRGTKIDNLVQIAHNVIIGENVLIAALCGIAGSARVGNGVMMGGQAGVSDHVDVGDRSVVAGRSGITKNIPPGSFVSGFPAINHREGLKIWALIRRLPELFERVKELERRGRDGETKDDSKKR